MPCLQKDDAKTMSQHIEAASTRTALPYFHRMPPAVFPSLLGLGGLALAWRAGASAVQAGPELPWILSAIATGLILFALFSYAMKLRLRLGVIRDDVLLLPGRAGVSAGILSIYMMAGISAPLSASLAKVVLLAGLALHLAVLAVLLPILTTGPRERRVITPIWHLHFVGFIVAARVAPSMGWEALASFIMWPALSAAILIWIFSLRQNLAAMPAPPMRPLFAIHLAPLALIGTVAFETGHNMLADILAVLSVLAISFLIASSRWLLAAGFTPFWGALTFPLAAAAGFWVTYAGLGSDFPGLIAWAVLLLATLVTIPVAFRIIILWANGSLAEKSGAATV